MNQTIDTLRERFKALTAHRGKDGKPYTQQEMAEKLNKDGVLSLSGKSWSKYSVRRILRKLELESLMISKKISGRGDKSDTVSPVIDDDEIRSRIRDGRYDTDTERFVAVLIVEKTDKDEAQDQSVTITPEKDKKEKKSKKGKKSKGKKDGKKKNNK